MIFSGLDTLLLTILIIFVFSYLLVGLKYSTFLWIDGTFNLYCTDVNLYDLKLQWTPISKFISKQFVYKCIHQTIQTQKNLGEPFTPMNV